LKRIIKILFLILVWSTVSKAQYTYFSVLDGSIGDEDSQSSSNIEVVDDGYVVWGVRTDQNIVTYFTKKFDLEGNLDIENSLSFPNQTVYSGPTGSFIYSDLNDQFVFAQGALQEDGSTKSLVIRFNTELDTIDSNIYNLYPPYNSFHRPFQVSDGYLLLGRREVPEVDNGRGTYFIKLDQGGELLWSNPISEVIPGLRYRNTTVFEENEKYILIGGKVNPGGPLETDDYTGIITITDLNGNLESELVVEDNSELRESYLVGDRLSNNSIALLQEIGYAEVPEVGNPDFLWSKIRLRKFDIESEDIIWQEDYHEDFTLLGNGIQDFIATPEGGMLILGSTNILESPFVKSYMMKVASDGTEEWFKEYSYSDCSSCKNQLKDIELTEDGGFVCVGSFQNSEIDFFETELWLLKVDACGDVEWQGCEPLGTTERQSVDFNLYPNPSTGKFTLEAETDDLITEYRIIDLSGRLLASYENLLPIGKMEIDVRFPSGIYLVEIETESGKIGRRKLQINQ